MANQIVVSAGAKVRNLNGVLTGTSGVVSSVPLGAANGVATLDSGGKVPVSQLPSSVVTYLGTWNGATNTPTLANGTGDAGDLYICNVAGTVNFGAGPITFAVGDWVIYGSGTWQKSSGQNGTVTSVASSITGNAIGLTGSPITTAGTLAFAFAGTNLQYVNGAGNLTTFPTLITSIGLSMPSAFSVSNSPLTANGSINVTGAGSSTQYIDGTGSLQTFPTIITEAQNLICDVYNETGATLTKGTIVYINGGHGNLPTVTKSQANNETNSSQTLGIVQVDITNMNNGHIVIIGTLSDLDTHSYAVGAILYLSPTVAGAWTDVKPSAPNHLVYVGTVVRSHPTQGVVEVRIQNGYELQELHNVSITSVANNDGLFYESATSLWKNKTIAAVLGYTPADDSLVVKLAGTQTITGVKTFGNGLILQYNYFPTPSTGDIGLGSNGSGITITTKPSTTVYNNTLQFSNGSNSFLFPNATGTIALTSNLTGYLTAVTATLPLSSSGGTTPNLSIAQSSSTVSGYLSSTDWSTFNSKVQGSFTSGTVPFATGTGSLGSTGLNYNGGYYGFATAANPSYRIDVLGSINISGTYYVNGVAIVTGVSSVFGRTGAVVATEGDYSLTQLSDVTITTPTSGQVLKYNGTTWINDTDANTGTVTSVGLSAPTGFSVSGSPVTSSGTLSLAFASGYSLPTTASQTNWDTAYTNRITSLTTTGSSGSATLVTNTLNIPTYTLSGLGGQPLATNLTSLSGLTYASTSFVKMSAAGTFSLDTNTYLTGNQTITLSGDVSGSGTTAITTTIGALKVTNAMLAGSIDLTTKVTGLLPDANISSASIWNAKQAALSGTGFVKSTAGVISYDTNTYLTANQAITVTATGEATGTSSSSGTAPSIALTLSTSAVTGKLLTGVNITGGTVVATDSILTAFGKVQNQINGLIGGSIYQGTWNASTNSPTLTSSVGTAGYYYIVSVAGSTNLNGITDWNIGDWAIFNGGVWQKVDNTDSVVSVNGFTGAVSLTTSNISQGTNLYFTNAQARSAISLTTTGTSGAATYSSSTGVLNIPQYADAYVGTVTSVAALTLGTSGTDLSSSVATGTTTPVITLNVPTASAANRGALSAADWTTFNSKQGTITLTTTGTSGAATFSSNTLNIPNYGSALSGYLPLTGGTLTGALSGTSATFSSTLRVNGGELTVYSGASIMYTGVDTGSSYAYIGTNTTSYGLSFQASGERMRIFSTGNISISSSPSDVGYKLDVNGTGRFSGNVIASSSTADVSFKATVAGDYFPRLYIERTGGTTKTNRLWSLVIGSAGSFNVTDDTGGTTPLLISTTGAATFSSSVTATNHIIGGVANTASIAATGYSLTGANAQSLIDLAGTWNTTGNPTAIKLNITNTASGASSKLLDLQLGGTSLVNLTKSGSFNINNTTNTTYKLSVYNTVEDTYILVAGTAPSLRFADTLTGITYTTLFGMATAANNFITGSAAGDFAITWNSAKKCYFGFTDTSTAKMTIDSSGNLGVGTTTMGSKTQINGNLSVGYSASTAAPTNGILSNGGIKTSAPAGASAATWKLGNIVATTVTHNRAINIDIDGTVYTILASTTVA